MGPSSDWVPLEFLFSELSTLHLLKFFHHSSDFLTLALVPQDVSGPESCDSLYLLIGLCNLGSSGLPCDLISLMDLRNTVDFSLSQLFTCC